MKSLAERLDGIAADRTALRKPELGFAELLKLASDRPAHMHGRSVVMQVSSLANALRAFAQLDGVARQIILASPSISVETALELGQRAGCDLLLTDIAATTEVPEPFGLVHLPLASREGSDREAAEADEDTAWLLTTSGTTGVPRLVSHSLNSLTRTTKVDFRRGEVTRWGLLYDYTRYAGLQVVLQSLLSGATLIAPGSNDPLDRQVAELVDGNCTHLSATPTLWRKILMAPNAGDLNLKQITLGGEIADQRILESLRKLFPDARVTHIYASTEAGVGFSVSDGREGFPAAYLEEPPAGIELQVRDGRLFVRNSSVRPTYVGSGESFVDQDAFVDTGDLVELRDDRFFFLGRENGTINVGGNKVHPEEVERVLLDHPSVVQARVYPRSNPLTGALVAADAVLQSDESPDEARRSILGHCRTNLQRYQVPVSIRIVKDLKLNASGKITRDVE